MCGIVGIYNHEESAKLAYLSLYAQQHRGQESAGIASFDAGNFHQHKAMGLVADVFNESTLKNIPGKLAIGQVRYSTTGTSVVENAQPFVVRTGRETIAVAHNGDLTNAREIRKALEDDGAIFQSTMDTEVVMHLIARE